MIRIGFTGVPGSGKTTTAREVAARCRSINQLKKVELVSEYARRYISKHGFPDLIWEQYRIMQKQIEWEDSIPKDNLDVMITDSPVFVSLTYALDFKISSTKDVMVVNDIFKFLTKLNFPTPRYDIIFHLPPVLKPIEDGVRPDLHFKDDWRLQTNSRIKSTFDIFRPVKFYEIDELTISEHVVVDFVLEKIEEYLKTTLAY
jgi:nicotinamide riboside kinase